MKYKSRKSGSVRQYRRILKEVRAIYDPFTQKYCPTCNTPCCSRPTRVTPLDVALASEGGCTFQGIGSRDPYHIAAEYSGERLLGADDIATPMDDDDPLPCEFLVLGKCCFSDDLRPYGCTEYICETMYSEMDEKEMRKLKRLIRTLTEAREAIERAINLV
jgi:hypothetical protein